MWGRCARKKANCSANAWLTRQEGNQTKSDFTRSLVRLRLEKWEEGTLRSWSGLEPQGIPHPEVDRVPAIGPHLYLGYGPLMARGSRTDLKAPPVIKADDQARLSLAVPEEEAPLVEQALALMHWYGTAGGRSRNGWGSFVLDPPPELEQPPLREWRVALGADWAHAIGQDGKGPLIWATVQRFSSWKEAIRALAVLRCGHPHAVPVRHWGATPKTRSAALAGLPGHQPRVRTLGQAVAPTQQPRVSSSGSPRMPPASWWP